MFLEVIASSLEDVKVISESPADRIELCESLTVGGLTPNRQFIFEATAISALPVNVIIRPNESWDFVYSEQEKAMMILEIMWIKEHTKANGIVIGALTTSGEVDWPFIETVVSVKGHLEMTFHKAFDQLTEKDDVYAYLAYLGVNNVLTSGAEKLADGMTTLQLLADKKLGTKILIGGGVTLANVKDCLAISDQIHIGTAARANNSWQEPISITKITQFKTVQ